MIVYATCVGSAERYRTIATPCLERVAGLDDRILHSSGNRSIATAYNRFLDSAARCEDLEALVLVHEDVAILDPNFGARVRGCLRDPKVGLIGVIGGRSLTSLGWWHGNEFLGRVRDGAGVGEFEAISGEVDAIDGLLMVLSPQAVRSVRFDETYEGFHGYDSDYSFAIRAAGLKVIVEPFVLFHDSPGDGLSEEFAVAADLFRRKWGDQLRAIDEGPRFPRAAIVSCRLRAVARAFEPGTQAVRELGRDLRASWKYWLPGGARRRSGEPAHDASMTASPSATDRRCVVCERPATTTPSGDPARCFFCGIELLGHLTPDDFSPIVSTTGASTHIGEFTGREHVANKRLAWIDSMVQGGTLLVVGHRQELLCTAAAERGYEPLSIDPGEHSTLEALRSSVETWIDASADFKVDAVVLVHVSSEPPIALPLLRSLRAVLAPGAPLLIECPAPETASHSGEAPGPGDAPWKDALAEALRQCGFDVSEHVAMTQRPYEDRRSWLELQRLRLARGLAQPARPLLRLVALASAG